MWQHKILAEFVREETTEGGAIPLQDSVEILREIARLGEKIWYQVHIKWTEAEEDVWWNYRKRYYDLIRVFRHANIFWAVTYFSKEMGSFRVEKIWMQNAPKYDKIFYDEIQKDEQDTARD